jgi:hypothetical protein
VRYLKAGNCSWIFFSSMSSILSDGIALLQANKGLIRYVLRYGLDAAPLLPPSRRLNWLKDQRAIRIRNTRLGRQIILITCVTNLFLKLYSLLFSLSRA